MLTLTPVGGHPDGSLTWLLEGVRRHPIMKLCEADRVLGACLGLGMIAGGQGL